MQRGSSVGKGNVMDVRRGKDLGVAMATAGVTVIVLAVLLIGLTTASGAIDWVSVITAVAGLVLAGVGLYTILRGKGAGAASGGSHPHTASRSRAQGVTLPSSRSVVKTRAGSGAAARCRPLDTDSLGS